MMQPKSQVKEYFAASVTDKDGKLIGNYATFADAVTAAEGSEGSTLTLLDDITLTEKQNINSGKFTLDLNSETLLNETGNTLLIESGADVTIKDSGEGGTVKSGGASSSAIINAGTLTVESGNIISEYIAVNSYGTLTINGGTFEGKENSVYIDGRTVEIYDGTFNGNVWGFAPYTINGGDFTAEFIGINCESGVLTVNGGTFDIDQIQILKGTVSLKGGEFTNGFTVFDLKYDSDAEQFAATFLADGYYYKDADGKLITVADDAKAISGYAKVAKGADFAKDAVITLSQTEYEYNGGENKPAVTVTVGGKTLDSANYSVSYADNINAGTATVTVTAVESDIYSGTATANFTITKAEISVTAPAANTLTYNGSAQALITAGSANIGKMQYSLDGTDYSETIPAGTNAGDYTVYYKVIGDANHNDTEPATVTVTINKKEVTASATVQDKIYDGTTDVGASAIEIKFDGIVDGDDFEVSKCMGMFLSPNAGNNKTIYVTYDVSGEDVNNYDIYEDGVSIPEKEYYYIETKANILPRDISDAVIVLGNALTYNGAEQTQEVTSVTVDGLYVTYTVSGDTATNVGVYELTITANTNFTGTKTVLYTINPDLSGIEGLDQYNVKSTNKADVENVYNQLDNAVTDLASADKKAEWKGIKDECWQWLKILESVAYKVESLGNSHLAYDIDTVTSADDEALESLEAEMYLFMRDYRDNMTEEELLKVDNARIEISKLRDRIAETKSEYERVIAAANGYDEATVTSADKDALVQLNDDIYALALTHNVTAEEKSNLQSAHNNVLGLIDKLTGISDEIKRIIEAVDKYVFESVKSSDKADIQQLIEDIKALLDTQNITADERTLLEGADETCDKLVAKIDETVAEINRINDATNAYDIDTVTSADKADVEKLIEDIKALTDGDNITDAEREQLNGNEVALNALLDKIGATADEIERIENAVNSYDEATVKSTDKADLEQLVEDIKALTDATNITAEEKAALEALDATADSLIKKIDDTAAEIARIDEAINAYDEGTVKSSDIQALGKLIEDIKALTDGDNITEDEKAALEADDAAVDALVEKLTEVAEEIKRVDEAVKSYDEKTIKSSDSEELAQLKDDVQALIDSTNTTENEKTAFGEMIKDIEALEDKIDETAKEIERIENAVNGYDEETVKSSDEETINQLKEDIQTLIDSGNVTEEEISGLEDTKADADALTDKIDETQAEIDRINDAVNSYTEDTVKSTDTEAIEQLKEDIQNLIDGGNVTDEEISSLEDTKDKADNLTDKIAETENQLEEIGNIENGYDSETVTSDDKAAIEAAIAEIEAVNPDNLTDEQKAEYDEIKSEFEALLNEIEVAEKSVADIGVEFEMFDENRVTIFWEDNIEAFKAKIDELLADENMGTAEKAKLNEYKAQAEKLIEIINTPKEYFSLRFFYLIWDCLTWKYNGILWIFSKIFGFELNATIA